MSNLNLHIGYFYPDLLNLYGDNGNVEILIQRARLRNIDVVVTPISMHTKVPEKLMEQINLVFMGGGPDSSQKILYEDLIGPKSTFLKKYVEDEKAGLYICGAYQLFGHYYKAADGSSLKGLGIFDLYTEHFGKKKPRCIGNTYASLDNVLAEDAAFSKNTPLGTDIVGFENHGGRTYLGKNLKPLAKIIKGHGNNSEDGTEGCFYKDSIGTYFHGPFLSKNPHIADYLIYKALKLNNNQIRELPVLDDSLIYTAHTASKKLKQ